MRIQPNNSGRRILDRYIGHDERRGADRDLAAFGGSDLAAVHTCDKAVFQQAGMAAGLGDIGHGPQEPRLGLQKIKRQICLRQCVWLQSKGHIDVLELARIDILGHPFAGLDLGVLGPQFHQPLGRDFIQAGIKCNLPAVRPCRQFATDVQRCIGVIDIHAAKGQLKWVELDLKVQISPVDADGLGIDIGRIGHQITQPDLRGQIAELAVFQRADGCFAFDPPRHPLALERQFIKLQQLLVGVIAEITAHPVKGDRRCIGIGLHHAAADLQGGIQRLERAVVVDAAAHGPRY